MSGTAMQLPIPVGLTRKRGFSLKRKRKKKKLRLQLTSPRILFLRDEYHEMRNEDKKCRIMVGFKRWRAMNL